MAAPGPPKKGSKAGSWFPSRFHCGTSLHPHSQVTSASVCLSESVKESAHWNASLGFLSKGESYRQVAQGQGAKTLTPTGLFVPQLKTWPNCGFLSAYSPFNFLSMKVDALLTAQRHRSRPIRNMALLRKWSCFSWYSWSTGTFLWAL